LLPYLPLAAWRFSLIVDPAPGEGELLVHNTLMSVEPYMRGRMNDAKSYVPPFGIGEPLARPYSSLLEQHFYVLLREGVVDGLVTGLTRTYPEAIRPALEIVRTQEGRRASGTYIVAFKGGLKLFADCTVNADPTAEELADIAVSTAELARAFELTPRIASAIADALQGRTTPP